MKSHSQKTISPLRALLALILAAGFLSGCATLHEKEETQQVPWSRPADWEGTIPGMPAQRG
ncbi:MAG: hypothetical protein LR015_08365 [Verrucomicrobia bacterium]|nr:hypothetical protein [Verrucomicrobiota bacterium]